MRREKSGLSIRAIRAISSARVIVALSWAVICAVTACALGQAHYVEFTATPGAFQLVNDGAAAPILFDSQDYPGVVRAARDLQADVDRVTRIRPGIIAGDGAPPRA